MDEHARLLGFSTRQGEQEVHGVGVSISGWRHALAPGSFPWLLSWRKRRPPA